MVILNPDTFVMWRDRVFRDLEGDAALRFFDTKYLVSMRKESLAPNAYEIMRMSPCDFSLNEKNKSAPWIPKKIRESDITHRLELFQQFRACYLSMGLAIRPEKPAILPDLRFYIDNRQVAPEYYLSKQEIKDSEYMAEWLNSRLFGINIITLK